MKAKEGGYRVVHIGEKYVVKTPNLLAHRLAIRRLTQGGGWKDLEWLLQPARQKGGFLNFTLGGVLENLREFYCSLVFRDVIVPTYLSICGVVNIQKRGEELNIAPKDLLVLWKHMGDAVFDADHTLVNPKHFVLCDGEIKLCDAGERHLISVLKQHRKQLKAALGELLSKNQHNS